MLLLNIWHAPLLFGTQMLHCRQACAGGPITKRANYVCEPHSRSALFLLDNLAKGVQHEEVAGEMIPGIMAEGGRQELPPLRIACVQIQSRH